MNKEELEEHEKYLEHQYKCLMADKRAGENVDTELGQCIIALITIKEQLY